MEKDIQDLGTLITIFVVMFAVIAIKFDHKITKILEAIERFSPPDKEDKK